VAAAGIGEQHIGQKADQDPDRARPPKPNHPGSFSHGFRL
jgi:hypothetical protein